MEAFRNLLRERNLKISSPRLLLMEKLFPPQAHFSAEELFCCLKPSLPALSPGTVYKNLDELRSAGILRMVILPGQVRQFEWNRGDHIHLVEGTQVQDLDDPGLFGEIRDLLLQKLGSRFEIDGIEIQISGKAVSEKK